uniref:PNOB8 ParB N-like protein n=1 Tax=Dulem virus 33 TaxID=3145751 RepID=A0AAU8B5N2_9CAUD
MKQLTIDAEFRDKIPPLSQDEFLKLEENILEDGEVREPLVVWHNTIIDGHHRWAIIQKHPNIPYKVKQMDFPDKWAAIVWMCRNQLGRRNLTDEQKTYLIGKQFEAEKLTHGGDRGTERGEHGRFAASLQNDGLRKSRGAAGRIAEELGVGCATVERAERFSKGIDEAEAISPGIRDAVLSGEVKAPKSVVAEIRNVPEEHRQQVVEAIKQGDTDTAKAIIRSSKPKPAEEPQEEPKPFTPEELGELIDAAAQNLDFALKQHLVLVHRDVLDTKEGRDVAQNALNGVLEVTQKYLDMIRRIKENGNEN